MALPSSAPATQNPFAEQSSEEAGEDAATPSSESNSNLSGANVEINREDAISLVWIVR